MRRPSLPATLLAASFFYSRGQAANGLAAAVPTWAELSRAVLPPNPPPAEGGQHLRARSATPSSSAAATAPEDHTLPTLYRERNGWCVHSSRLWFALERKGVRYNTVLVEARGDTYDGSPARHEAEGTDGWPEELLKGGINSGLPHLRLVDGQIFSGEGEAACLSLLAALDELFPETKPIWPPLNEHGQPACKSQDVLGACEAFLAAAPGPDVCCPSPRAAWLFCGEEGYRLDALPRKTFEGVLDAAENYLGSFDGHFFCGRTFSAADIFWSPLLERYSAQLPCLHEGLWPRNDNDGDNSGQRRWPKLQKWYGAMDTVPEYACCIRGDGPSWRKVLYREPWWPSAEIWHPRETVGSKGELKATEEEAIEAFGDAKNISNKIWEQYASTRPHVAGTPEFEAAACLLRHRRGIQADISSSWIEEWGSPPTEDAIDAALRMLVWSLSTNNAEPERARENPAMNALGAYLDDRLCVPRDMPNLAVARLRKVLHELAT